MAREEHVLEAIRQQHDIPLKKVRRAVALLERQFGSRHPLADDQFETDGLDLFIQHAGLFINVTQTGQLAIREFVQAYLNRVERDEPRAVVIDPFVSFGRPVLAGTGISTAVVAERFKAGEPMGALADTTGGACLRSKKRSGASSRSRRPSPPPVPRSS